MCVDCGNHVPLKAPTTAHDTISFLLSTTARYIARKGSITIQGVSLTVNAVNDAEFEVNLIPHTVNVTTLKHLRAGMKVNLEVDLIARYVERMLNPSD